MGASDGGPGPRQIFQRLMETTGVGASDEMVDLYHPDVLIEMRSPHRASRRGREELRSAVVATNRRIDGVEVTAIHDTPDPEVIVAEWIPSGEVGSTGRRFGVAYLMVTRVRGGLVVASRDYSDLIASAASPPSPPPTRSGPWSASPAIPAWIRRRSPASPHFRSSSAWSRPSAVPTGTGSPASSPRTG